MIERVAGITPVNVGDEPAFELPNGSALPPGVAMETLYNQADKHIKDEFLTGQRGPRGEDYDERLPILPIEQGLDKPGYDFLITRPLLLRIAQQPPSLSRNALLKICLEQGDDAVDPDFSSTAINAINTSYYGAPAIAFAETDGVATMYATSIPLNYALGTALARTNPNASSLRVKELASGPQHLRWKHLARAAIHEGAASVDVTLTDFVSLPPPTPPAQDLTLSTERYSLFDDMQDLPHRERYHAMLASYAFDSVWLPEDLSLEQIDGTWYQNLYRVKIADWNRRKEQLLEAMRCGEPLSLPYVSPTDYDGIAVELAQQPYTLDDHPYAEHISNYGEKIINFPGGLIRRVVDAFNHQLTENGVFINGDVGYFGGARISMPSRPGFTGVAGRYKEEDFVIAKKILEQEHGFRVNLHDIKDFVATYSDKNAAHTSSGEYQYFMQSQDMQGNGIMIVRR